MATSVPALSFVLKLSSRCNLNCAYCYVYNKGDSTWRDRPSAMSTDIFRAAIERIRGHCEASHQEKIRIVFHGGEPCLIGVRRFAELCRIARRELAPRVVRIAIQTNGTLIDDAWAAAFNNENVEVGVSLDGPQESNDRLRIDHAGRGSYTQVVSGLAELNRANVPFHVLSVVRFGCDGVRAHRHFLELGAQSIDYLLPDFTHDTIAPVHVAYGPTPCSDYLLPIFDEWWFNGNIKIPIRIFWTISRIILGGIDEIDLFGNKPLRFVFVETDGSIEGLDVLRICRNGLAATGLFVQNSDFIALEALSSLHSQAIFAGIPMPRSCIGCIEEETCAGGYIPHRFSARSAFDNPSVWCADIKKLFAHLRMRLNVSPEETRARRQGLQQLVLDGRQTTTSS